MAKFPLDSHGSWGPWDLGSLWSPVVPSGLVSLPRGHLAKSGDTFGCHHSEKLLACSIAARGASNHPTMHSSPAEQGAAVARLRQEGGQDTGSLSGP